MVCPDAQIIVGFPPHNGFGVAEIEPASGAPEHATAGVPENSSAPMSGVEVFLVSPS